MRSAQFLTRRVIISPKIQWHSHRSLLTLAIETSCDDTSVAILEKSQDRSYLHFHSKKTSDSREFQGIHPVVALHGHQKNLASLVKLALQNLPIHRSETTPSENSILVRRKDELHHRVKPDFVTVTRGPGMRSCLNTGLEIAKGLAVAWDVPLLAVNHMQAHALTPRLVSSLESDGKSTGMSPEFPFLSLLVSGGHTLLVESRELCSHKILADTIDIAIGDFIDKCAREILPKDVLDTATTVMYGALLEKFAFPNGFENYPYHPPSSRKEDNEIRETGYEWKFTPPLSRTQNGARKDSLEFSFSGTWGAVERTMNANPTMEDEERRALARETMQVAFQHVISRILIALKDLALDEVKSLVIAGGVAANHFLRQMLKKTLDQRGFEHLQLMFPPPSLCTDNAAMIAWTGMEMWEHGLETDLSATSLVKWSLDQNSEDGGILGVDGWVPRSRQSFEG